MFFRKLIAVLGVWACAAISAAAQSDPTLYSLRQTPLFDGRYGKLAEVQQAVNLALARCRKPPVAADGRFGPRTAQAVRDLTTCAAVGPRLPAGSQAFQGAITKSLWLLLLPRAPLPTVEQRAQTLVLTYENTDYTDLEWNFCQSRGPDGTRWSPDDPTKPCYTNDPRSYITWGPRGATAGHGREVQWILWRVERQNRAVVSRAFGPEAAAARQLLTLDDDSAKRFLCSVFADTARRAAWTAAFAELGKSALVRRLYDRHYLSRASDGAKMERLYQLYERLGVAPTEIDYAFFLDRATHSTPPTPDAANADKIRQWLTMNNLSLTPPNARRAFAAVFPTRNQTQDRLGRDVAFFIDAFTETGLTTDELAAWRRRGQLSAANVGLADERAAPPLNIANDTAAPVFNTTLSSPCPAPVLNPNRPPR
jgi:hypothetical protein